MSERKTEVAVGLIVTAALLILVLGIIWGRDVDILSRRTFLIIHFNNVYGLEKSDPVLVRGMKQGEVDRIILKSEYVEVHLWIKQHVLLYSDMRVTIENRELVGGKQISIDQGRSGLAADIDKVYIGEVDGDLGLLLIKVGEVLADVDDVLGRLKVVLVPDHFENILQNVEEATIRVRELIAENRQGLRATMQRFEEMTQRFQEDSTITHVGNVVTQLDSAVYLIKKIAVQMEQGDGTFGSLLRDRVLYDQLLKTSCNLDSLITDIKTNPKHYIHFSLF